MKRTFSSVCLPPVKLGTDAAARRINDFNKGWKFYPGDNSGASNQNFDDSRWDRVNLPHDFSITRHFTATGEAESGFLPGGTGWYRKSFLIGGQAAGKTFLLRFDGVYMNAYVYVNGKFVGEHHYGYTPFAFDLTGHLICDGATQNVVAVKVINHIPSSRWYSGSGIYRDVTLYALDRVHVDLHGVTIRTPGIAEGDGTAAVKVRLVNNGETSAYITVRTTISGTVAETNVTVPAGSAAEAKLEIPVENPALWSIETPNLYNAVTEVLMNGEVVDACEDTFGYRWFGFCSSGFYLNGKAVKLNGVCMHHDQGGLGAAAYDDAMYRQLSIMKDMGVNAIRTAHNPADEDFIAICNELGLLVIEETFDGLVDYKNENINDFSCYFEKPASEGLYGCSGGMTNAEYAARAHVRRDKNAPAIIAWSFGNEIQEGTYWQNVSRYAAICADYICWVNSEDGTRPVTGGDNNRGGSPDLVNVINTITAAGGIAGFNYANTSATLCDLARRFGGGTGAIIASETASATNSRGQYRNQNNNADSDGKYHLTSYDTSAVPWGSTAHETIYNTFLHDCVAGTFVWTGFDYIGEPTPWNGTTPGDDGRGAVPNSAYFGIVETTGFPKDSFWLYRAQWNKDAATVHLVTAWDRDNMMTDDSGRTPVWLYTNAPKVELYLNDTLIGTAVRHAVTSPAGHTCYTYTAASHDAAVCSVSNGRGADALYAVFRVAYTAGTLRARAYDEAGNEIALDDSCGRCTVSTPEAACALAVAADRAEIHANGYDLVYVEVGLTDAKGSLKTTATHNITFHVDGPAEIAAVDNGDQATVRKYQNSYVLTDRTNANIDAYAGKALVILRSTGEAGEITLTIGCDGMERQRVTIHAVSDGETGGEGLVSWEMVRDYTVKAGTAPRLDTAITGCLADGSCVGGVIAWNEIPEALYGTAGDHSITGVASFANFGDVKVSARLHVIPNVIALRNISAATLEHTLPTLPATVCGVLADGTLAGEFAVNWNMPDAAVFHAVGKIVAITGSAAVFGDEILEVTCTVRVAGAVNTGSGNVAPMADIRTAIPNTISLTWATAQTIGSVNLYGACPGDPEFRYSLNGAEYVPIGYTAGQVRTCSLGAMRTYTFDKPINPVALQVSSYGANLTGLEVMSYAASLKRQDSAALSAICVDGLAVGNFDPAVYAYEIAPGEVTVQAAENVGITILPEYEHVVRILTVSEDGKSVNTYQLFPCVENGPNHES